jgi:hypothetical protein
LKRGGQPEARPQVEGHQVKYICIERTKNPPLWLKKFPCSTATIQSFIPRPHPPQLSSFNQLILTQSQIMIIRGSPSKGQTSPKVSSRERRLCNDGRKARVHPEAEISKNYCATNSGSPEVELRFLCMAQIVHMLNWVA